ncbi:MAG: AbrB/MazE/SpoVT family DNA-binding domain-containing protein, partial [Thermoproteota archaeon]
MVELRVRVGEKGQILIPKILRDRYGIQEGAQVMIE